MLGTIDTICKNQKPPGKGPEKAIHIATPHLVLSVVEPEQKPLHISIGPTNKSSKSLRL